ncbi:sensor histidine kinase [Methylobacterium nodulans]|uniref:histidine kinase n=1 Tax=Methylobacterium nodulans (strain LMG 21967 / CNCM I-2342 / ORS 2060) TaxID=460265 RepID=B8IXZ4_METNO|nr:DUF4118 domain-containing protein [Methylobacterium nodulans]ACL63284.1 signal transduction histidine kinase [Methylobacterium nodulans ORS 2060]
MKHLFTETFRTPGWPTWAQYLATTAVVTAVLLVRVWLGPHLSGFPVLLFFAAIIVCAVLFDRGCGIYAVLLSAGYVAYFLLSPIYSLKVASPSDIVGLFLFVAIGLATVTIIAAFHSTLHNLAEANTRLAASEQEKDLLLREASHRIRNDLTTLMALVKLQYRTVQDETARAMLAATADRMQVLARVHERLRRDTSKTTVGSYEFLSGLCNDLRTSMIGLRPVVIRAEVEDHALPQDRAVAVGLILNECVTNAMKYAFPDNRPGIIAVRFRREDDALVLEVRDDGVGVAFDGPERARGTGLGQRLIRSMVAQLEGIYDIRPNGGASGTVVTIRFPANP